MPEGVQDIASRERTSHPLIRGLTAGHYTVRGGFLQYSYYRSVHGDYDDEFNITGEDPKGDDGFWGLGLPAMIAAHPAPACIAACRQPATHGAQPFSPAACERTVSDDLIRWGRQRERRNNKCSATEE